MKISKQNRIKTGFRSVAARSLLLIIITTVVLLSMETISLFEIYNLNRQAIQNYKRSIDYYMTQCDNSLTAIVNSMIQITTNRMIDNSYANMCYLDGLPFEIAKRTVQTRVLGYAQIHDYLAYFFVYVPERDICLTSMSIKPQSYNELIYEIVNDPGHSTTSWMVEQYQEEDLFVRCLKKENGYIIALVPIEKLFYGLFPEEKQMLYQIDVCEGKSNSLVYTITNSKEFEIAHAECFPYYMQDADALVNIYVDRRGISTDFSVGIILLTLFIGVSLLFFNIYFQMKFLLKPIYKLRQGMEEFSSGKLDVQLPLNDLSAEMIMLFTTFNNMTKQIRNLKIEIYEAALEREKVYNDYIQVQIQPHFYANILNLIYGMSQCQDYQGIATMAFHAGAYFRYLLSSKGSFVMLQNEIDSMKHYMEIQKMRYEDYLVYSVEIPEKLKKQLIIPMLIQTFAANSIKHNVTFVPVLEVKVMAWEDAGKIYITVRDNGTGISEEMLKQILENQLGTEQGSHIGIRNVRARLRLFYGDKAELKITSTGTGTDVCIILPEIVTASDGKGE